MARYLNITVVLLLQLGILVSALPSAPTDGLSLFSIEERLQQLTENYVRTYQLFFC